MLRIRAGELRQDSVPALSLTDICPKGLAPSRAIEKIRLVMFKDSPRSSRIVRATNNDSPASLSGKQDCEFVATETSYNLELAKRRGRPSAILDRERLEV